VLQLAGVGGTLHATLLLRNQRPKGPT